MTKSFKTQLAGQIGESLVVVELGRRGIVATAFAGNVPDIDLLAYKNGRTAHIQVKAIRTGGISLDAKRFMNISFDGDRQIIDGPDDTMDRDLIYVFVSIGSKLGEDRFHILTQGDLKDITIEGHSSYLAKHGGVRPKNPSSTHVGVSVGSLAEYEDNWSLIEGRFL